jgi:hypothetical protein
LNNRNIAKIKGKNGNYEYHFEGNKYKTFDDAVTAKRESNSKIMMEKGILDKKGKLAAMGVKEKNKT